MNIDIKSNQPFPAGQLSNFYPHAFLLDSVACASMEGFLQSLKTRSKWRQRRVCALAGRRAKRYFRYSFCNFRWKRTGVLYWQGQRIGRHSPEYMALLRRAYGALFQNPSFRHALLATGDCELTHSIGEKDPTKTVLTEGEFVALLYELREKL